jgi:TonB family protein
MERTFYKLGRWGLCCFALWFSAVPALRADVTVRYRAQTSATAPAGLDLSASIHVKGNKVYTTAGGMTMIIDAAKQEITLIDAAHKRFATIPASQYGKSIAAAMPDMPADISETMQSMFAKTKTTVETRNTGRTDTIQGIQAAERETTASIEMPLPEGMPGMRMNMVVRTWTAKPEEVLRVPALRELAALNTWQQYFMDPTGALMQFGQMGGGAMAPLKDAMRQDGVILRTRMQMFMPMPGALAGQAPGQGPAGEAEAGPKPLFEMSTELVELSSAPVDDALFQIPAEYAAADFGELMKGAITDMEHAAAAAPSKPAPPRQDGAKAYVPALFPVKRVEPVYPAEARGQSLAEDIELLATLDPQGNVTNAEALTGAQILRQPAIDAVKQWKFRPVLRDGQPVIALTSTTISFSTSDAPLPRVTPNIQEEMEADRRLEDLATEMPRTPQQVLGDLEQDAVGRNAMERFYALNDLTKAALNAGAPDKADAYANELLAAAGRHKDDWNYGNAIHNGHTALGLLAIRRGDVEKAREHLLESAQTDGSPQLDSFGPSMSLAKELLDKGETVVVLQYFTLCRSFWKMGGAKLDAWSDAVRNGKTPEFGVSLW